METLSQLIILAVIGVIIYSLFIYQKKLSLDKNKKKKSHKKSNNDKAIVDRLQITNADYENLSQCTIGSVEEEF